MLRDAIPYLKFGGRIHPSELLGGALLGMTTGNVYYIMATDASEYADFLKEYNVTYKDGSESVKNTVDAGVNVCTASKYDVIAVTPGHTESITAAGTVSADIIGITIMGLGNFETRPVLTLDTDTGADVNIGADDIRISNIVFKVGLDDMESVIDVDDNDFQVDNCKFVADSSYQALNFINLATTLDNFVIKDCEFLQDTDPAGTNAAADTGGIFLVDSENILIQGCAFYDNFETAAVHNRTTACKNLVIRDTFFGNVLSDAHILVLVAGAEGVAYNVHGYNTASADVAEANLWGTIGTKFWIHPSCALGNDSGGGGQLAVNGTAACT